MVHAPVCIDGDELQIGEEVVKRGHRRFFMYPVARLYDLTEIAMPVCVVRGSQPGPVLLLLGAIHGDELIGPEVIKRVLHHKRLRLVSGSVIAVPIVNVFGHNYNSRYLPDRRDLNRSFPGSQHGSLGARLAYLLMKDFVSKASHGIDLHAGAVHRSNFPQIRANLGMGPELLAFAQAFGAPVILNSKNREGSVRSVGETRGVKFLVFEGGEALRIEEPVARVAVAGILNVLEYLGMIESQGGARPTASTFIAQSSYWLRTPQSGSIRMYKSLGAEVKAETKLATVSDVFGMHAKDILAKSSGMVIGDNRIPLVNKGDAVFHIATFEDDCVISDLARQYSDLIDHLV